MAGTGLDTLLNSGQDPQTAMTQRFMPGAPQQQPQMPTSMPAGGGMMMPSGQQPGGAMGASNPIQLILGSLLGAIKPPGAMGGAPGGGQPQPTMGGAPGGQPQPPMGGGQPQPGGPQPTYGDGTNAPLPPPPQVHSPGRGLFGMFPNPGAANRDAIDNYNQQAGYADYRNRFSDWQAQKKKQEAYDIGDKAAAEAAAGYGSETNVNPTETATAATIRSLKKYSPGIEKNPEAMMTATKLLEPLIGKDVTERLRTAAEAQKEQHQDTRDATRYEQQDKMEATREADRDKRDNARFGQQDRAIQERADISDRKADERAAQTERRASERDEAGRLRGELSDIDKNTTDPYDRANQRFHVQVSSMSADNEDLASVRDRLLANPQDKNAIADLTTLKRRWNAQAVTVFNAEAARLSEPCDINNLKVQLTQTQNAINGYVNGVQAGTIKPSEGRSQGGGQQPDQPQPDQQAAPAAPKQVTSQSEFDALPSGATFLDADGNPHRKN